MGLLDKKVTEEDRKRRSEYKRGFNDYFDEYYRNNSAVKSISYYDMKNEDGYSAVIEYEVVRQYVNVFWDECTINTYFELESRGNKFLVTMSSILDEMDSDDIEFYNVSHCASNEKMRSALDLVMGTTEKYYSEICSIASTPERADRIYDELAGNVYDDDEIPSIPEEVVDLSYLLYEVLSGRAEAKKELKKAAKKNKLKTRYEKRAYRVLSQESKSEVRKYDKTLEKQGQYPLKDRILMNAPSVVIAVVFCLAFAFVGNKLDDYLFPDWIGRTSYTSIFFGALGVILSIVVSSLIPDSFYKLFVSEEHFTEFTLMLHSEKSTKLERIIFGVVAVIGLSIMGTFFCFTGTGYTPDGDYLNKSTVFSEVQHYPLSEMEIAIIDDTDGDGEWQYLERAYAFKIDDVWEDIGVPDDEAKPIIEKAISEKTEKVKIYENFEDIEG